LFQEIAAQGGLDRGRSAERFCVVDAR
jgi:hypothetical protein